MSDGPSSALTAERDQLRSEVEQKRNLLVIALRSAGDQETRTMDRTDSEITFTGAYTCTHHNDAMRAACPVCLVATLTERAERAEADLAAERARLDYLLQWDVTFHDRADIDAELSYGQRNKSTPTLP